MLTLIITLAGVTPVIGADTYSFFAVVHEIAVTPSALFSSKGTKARQAQSLYV